jgi:hypothetical protein
MLTLQRRPSWCPIEKRIRRVGEHSAGKKSQRPNLLQYLVERFFNKINECRRVATRYDKLAANYLAFVKLASIRIWLRANESAPARAASRH